MLAAGVVHDSNNILTAILGYNEMVRSLAGENREVVHLADQVRKAIDMAAAVNRSLLRFSRKGTNAKVPLDLVIAVLKVW